MRWLRAAPPCHRAVVAYCGPRIVIASAATALLARRNKDPELHEATAALGALVEAIRDSALGLRKLCQQLGTASLAGFNAQDLKAAQAAAAAILRRRQPRAIDVRRLLHALEARHDAMHLGVQVILVGTAAMPVLHGVPAGVVEHRRRPALAAMALRQRPLGAEHGLAPLGAIATAVPRSSMREPPATPPTASRCTCRVLSVMGSGFRHGIATRPQAAAGRHPLPMGPSPHAAACTGTT